MLATGDYYVCFCERKMFEARKKSNDFVILTNLKTVSMPKFQSIR